MASTLVPAPSTFSSPKPKTNAVRFLPASAPSGTGTRSGSSLPAERSTLPSPRSTPVASADFIFPDDRPVAAHPARYFHRISQSHQKPGLDPLLGFLLLVLEPASRRFFRRRSRQRRARRSARSNRLFLRAALDQLPNRRSDRHPRLVHHPRRRASSSRPHDARRALAAMESFRRSEQTRRPRRRLVLVGRPHYDPARHRHNLQHPAAGLG